MIPDVTSSTGFILYGDQTTISNCMYFNVSNNIAADVIKLNLINADPLFKNVASGDFTLATSSPAYNAGDDGKTLGDPRWWPKDSFIYVAAGENVISQARASALDGQTLILTTDGGIYNEAAMLIVDKKIMIKAADGLQNKPVLTSGSTSAMIEISSDFLLKGVILDGAQGAALTAIGITNKPNTSGYDLAVLESDFLNFSNAGGTSGFGIFGVPSSVMDSVFIQDCYFKHILDMGISFNDPLTATGSVNHFMVDNCTFWDMNSEAIYVDGSDSNVATKDPKFYVNKVTLYDCGSYCIIAHYIDSAVISNSIVVLPVLNTSYAPTKIYGTHSKVENFLYFNTRDIDMGSGVTDFQFFNVVVQENPMFTDAGNGIFSYPVNSPAVIQGDGGVKICIGDDRWWPTIIVGIEETNYLKGYELNQNYPNPFSSDTKISYKVPVSGKVVLKVYNAAGSEVMTLVNKTKIAGSYDVSFDASSFANGIYYYRLKTGSFDETKRMVLLK